MQKLTFCVVDDAVFMRTLLKKMIEEVEGYKVVGEGSTDMMPSIWLSCFNRM